MKTVNPPPPKPSRRPGHAESNFLSISAHAAIPRQGLEGLASTTVMAETLIDA
jgi:hypothetical protein